MGESGCKKPGEIAGVFLEWSPSGKHNKILQGNDTNSFNLSF